MRPLVAARTTPRAAWGGEAGQQTALLEANRELHLAIANKLEAAGYLSAEAIDKIAAEFEMVEAAR